MTGGSKGKLGSSRFIEKQYRATLEGTQSGRGPLDGRDGGSRHLAQGK